jgi:hypothetical protein
MNKKIWIGIVLLWGIAIFLVNPVGDFPLNDDWAFGRNVYNLTENGILKFTDYAAMSLLSQVLWGSLFCKIFFFSFTVLRVSTLVLSFIGTLVFFRLVRNYINDFSFVFLTVFLVVANPLFFSLSFTFMTDVPFLVFCLLSVWFYWRYIENEKGGAIILGSIFALIATLTRQLGIMIPVAFVLSLLVSFRANSGKVLISSILSFLFVFGGLILYSHFMKEYGVLAAKYSGFSQLIDAALRPGLLNKIWSRFGIIILTLGFFLIPVVLIIVVPLWKTLTKGKRWVAIVITAILMIPAIIMWDSFPLGNVVYDYSIGPKVLKDASLFQSTWSRLPEIVLDIIRVAALAGAAGLLFIISNLPFSSRKTDSRSLKPQKCFLLWICIIYFFFLLTNVFFFDRYFLPLLPLTILIIVPLYSEVKKWIMVTAFGITGIFFLFSVAGTHDYLSWNRARWTALESLKKEGITPDKTDGGYEFNGWYNTNAPNPEITGQKSWWYVKDDEWAVSFGNLSCYKPVRVYPWFSWLNLDTDSIWLLKRQGYSDTISVFCNSETLAADSASFLTSVPEFTFGNGSCRNSEKAFSGKFSIKLDNNCSFGYTVKLKNITPCSRFLVRVWTDTDLCLAGIVVTAPQPNNFYLLQKDNFQKKENNWYLLESEVTLPENYPFSEVDIYVWNPTTTPVWFDDFSVSYFKHE